MYVDSNLKAEVLSSILQHIVKPYDKKGCVTTENILSVDDFHLYTITGKRQAYVTELFIDEKDFFDPRYDFDFTNLSDSSECLRGDEPYKRPKGWYRMALKVKGKYPDGDTWLGTDGWRSRSVPGEWPVSYHGTSLDGAKGIIRSHYKAGSGAMYGRGIYSTPDIHVAEKELYAKTFTSKTTGKRYKVILQNRINPVKREICQMSDYWLIPVHKGVSAEKEKQIAESSIRPYGILIQEISDNNESNHNGTGSLKDGWRSRSVPGGRPVSHHGTSLDGANNTISNHDDAGLLGGILHSLYSTVFRSFQPEQVSNFPLLNGLSRDLL